MQEADGGELEPILSDGGAAAAAGGERAPAHCSLGDFGPGLF